MLKTSSTAERIWISVHTHVGEVLVCNWYRPPRADDEVIQSFRDEFRRLSDGVLATIVVGDLNVHHLSWLGFSNSISREGRLLKEACDDCGLTQYVRGPTRGEYLLDLCLSDLSTCNVSVGHAIADHKYVLCKTPYFSAEVSPVCPRGLAFQAS